MPRRQEEFYCGKAGGGCEQYFLTWLRDDMTGPYTIECPNCQHHHYRMIKDGLVTEERKYAENGKQHEILVGLKSTLRKEPWTNDPEFKRRQLRAYNGGLYV